MSNVERMILSGTYATCGLGGIIPKGGICLECGNEFGRGCAKGYQRMRGVDVGSDAWLAMWYSELSRAKALRT